MPQIKSIIEIQNKNQLFISSLLLCPLVHNIKATMASTTSNPPTEYLTLVSTFLKHVL